VVGDLLLARFAGKPGPTPVGRIRLFAALMPPAMWALFFLCVALFQDGLGWAATLWVGVLATTAGLGWAISMLVFTPFSGAVSEQQVLTEGA
jgi:hypothetical protein